MGITISHKIGIADRKIVKKTLDIAERVAGFYKEECKRQSIPMKIRRENDTTLYIDIGQCETLSFAFKNAKQITEESQGQWSYLYSTLTDDGKKPIDAGYRIEDFPQNELFYCSSFCKTQFAKNIFEHKTVAEIIRVVASRAKTAEVDDEGDYYYTGDIADAEKSIESNGKIIDALGTVLSNMGYQVKKGDSL